MFIEDDTEVHKTCNCLSACNSIDYEYDLVEEKITPENQTIRESSLIIYFGDDEFVAYKRIESQGIVDLLSKIGSFLGLFLGISFLSIIEMIYFLTLRLFSDFWIEKPKDQKLKPEFDEQ